MSYLEDSIVHGETYDISITPQDSNGDSVILDDSWSAAIRFSRLEDGRSEVISEDMVIADGVASISFDTGDSPWEPGVLWYDTRLTDGDGHDYWSSKIKLTINSRITEHT